MEETPNLFENVPEESMESKRAGEVHADDILNS